MKSGKLGFLVPFIGFLIAGGAGALAQQASPTSGEGPLVRAAQSFNPDMSVIVDMFYHHDNSEEGISHVAEEMSGFGHAHGGEEHHHGEPRLLRNSGRTR